MVPFKAHYQSGASYFPVQGREDCEKAGLVTAGYEEIWGQATHLGRFTSSLLHCFNPDTGVFTAGESTYIAANGDTVDMIYYGRAVDDQLLIDNFTIVGGTGRFEGATGGGTGSGVFLDVGTTWEFVASLEGMISSPGSIKH
jgi:hypothetical protein